MSDEPTDLLERMFSFSAIASWAVWGVHPRDPSIPFARDSDISFPSAPVDGVLHARTIILGLNRGGVATEEIGPPWSNFHTGPRHNDHFIAEAFRDTPHWGAYMTDLLAEINSRSAELDTRPATVRNDVASLALQLRNLEVEDPLFICMGTTTAREFSKHCDVIARAIGASGVRWVQVPHYSAANGRIHKNRPDVYRRLVHETLDAAASQPGS